MVMIEMIRATLVMFLLMCATINLTTCTVEMSFTSDSDVPHTYKEFQDALANADGGANPNAPVNIAFDGRETMLALYAALGRAGKYVNLDLSESSVTGFGDNDSSSPLGMSFIVSILLPNNLARIGDNAFESCVHLREVLIPNSVAEIGEYAFYRCLSLANITIPESVEYIDRDAFSQCDSLETVWLIDDVRIADITVFPGGVKFREAAALSDISEDGSYVAVRGLYQRNGAEWSRL